jgi:hypothetical protein
MECKICDSSMMAADSEKKRIIHLTAATRKEKKITFSRENRLNILSDLTITSISAVDASAQDNPIKVL